MADQKTAMSREELNPVEEWEICTLWHDVKKGKGIHEVRLSIHKGCEYRQTYCLQCGHSVKFYRKPLDSGAVQ